MSRIVVMRAKAERLEIEPVRLNESGPHRASGWKPEVWRLQIHPRIGSFLKDRIKFLYVN